MCSTTEAAVRRPDEGIKREAEVDRSDSITPQTGRKLDRAIIVFLALAVVLLLGERTFREPAPAVPDIAATPEASAPAPQAESGPPRKSVAVLPFADLSQTQDQEWFADGLAEEILNALARTPDLLVGSRTTSFSYKGSNKVGQLTSTRLKTLKEFSKCLFLDDEDQ